MNPLGTYSTFDAPLKDEAKALSWLIDEFDKIGGRVWRKINQHDFGPYPSFEVDYPTRFLHIDEDECDCGDCETCSLIADKQVWEDKANNIESKFYKLFE